MADANPDWSEPLLSRQVREPSWRVWRYSRPAVVLGYSQRGLAGGRQGPEVREPGDDPASHGLPLRVRTSGGGAVLVGPWMLGLWVALPAGHPLVAPGPIESYRWLGELLAEALRGAGVAARALPPEEVRDAAFARARAKAWPGFADPLAWACFAGLSPWEVVAQGRKLAGLAQTRRRQGALFVAGVLLDRPDWPLLCAALQRPPGEAEELARRTTSLAQETQETRAAQGLVAPERGRAGAEELLLAAIARSLRERTGASGEEAVEEPVDRSGRLHLDHVPGLGEDLDPH